MGDLRIVDGLAMEDRPPTPSSTTIWDVAEQTTLEMIRCIRPTLDSEEKRRDVIDYVQRLIRNSLGHEVFPYGSVPLKTYLPDGDIDLTAICNPGTEEALSQEVYSILKTEQDNEKAEFKVKAIQIIGAEVKILKCLVQNIVIDISFNQLGGLCTLCFLEEVDQIVGKDHLFKRSIVLIKAWCYYESRILGAHHGLISTYALETLVLYIFHMFHGSLNGPFQVLYRFLDYFSNFDWDNFGISLKGPVVKSAFPSIVVEKPKNWGGDLKIRKDFFRECLDVFSVPSKSVETQVKVFPSKYLNIVDPLKENNNLGRSVNLGNFRRIRSAFKLGARRLSAILTSPIDEAGEEIKKFFGNTLERHGDKFCPFSTLSPSRSLTDETFSGDFSDYELEKEVGKITGRISGFYLPGDTSWRISSGNTSDCSLSSLDLIRAPHSSYFSGSSAENGKSPDNNSALSEGKSSISSNENLVTLSRSHGNDEERSLTDSGVSDTSSTLSDCLILDFREMNSDDDMVREDLEILNPLADLSGDYDGQIRNLLWGKRCLGTGILPPYNGLMAQSFACIPPTTFPCTETSNQVGLNPLNLVYVYEENKRQRGTEPFHPNVIGYPSRNRSFERTSWRNHKSSNFGNHQRQIRKHQWPENNPAAPETVAEKKKSVEDGFLPSVEESLARNGSVCNAIMPNSIIFGSLQFPMDDGSNCFEKKNPKAATALGDDNKRETDEGSYLLKKEDFPPLSSQVKDKA